MIANGITEALPLDLAEHVLSILVLTGRTVPARLWVESFVIADRNRRMMETAANLPHNRLFGGC